MENRPSYEINQFKVIIIGETAVGKSCILRKFVNGIFQDNFESTLAAAYQTKCINFPKINRSVQLNLWDTAGQEKFRAVTKIHYKDAAAILLVYDITRIDTFEEIKNYWYKEVISNSTENPLLFLVGNKNDYYEYEEVDSKESEAYASEINANFHKTSAKTGQGVDELFKTIAIKLIDPENYQELLKEEGIGNQERFSLDEVSRKGSKYDEGHKKNEKCC